MRTVPRPREDPRGAGGCESGPGAPVASGPESPAPPSPTSTPFPRSPRSGPSTLMQRPCSPIRTRPTSPSTSCLRASAMPRTSSGGPGLPGRDTTPPHHNTAPPNWASWSAGRACGPISQGRKLGSSQLQHPSRSETPYKSGEGRPAGLVARPRPEFQKVKFDSVRQMCLTL